MAENHHQPCCCGCFWRFFITSGLTALFLWLSLRTSNPTCSIQDFYVPSLNLSNSALSTNHSIFFDLQLQNNMNDKGVHYANINLTIFFNSSTSPVSNFTVPQFYQGRKKRAHRRELVVAEGLPWSAATAAVGNGSEVLFRVRVDTRVKFKILFWYTKRYRLAVGGDVAVDRTGRKVRRKGIKLGSGGPDSKRRVWVGPVFVFAFFVLFS